MKKNKCRNLNKNLEKTYAFDTGYTDNGIKQGMFY